ncbi:LysR family transcriptional regulator [Glaciimonas sp. PCH181]|nr:LysR family transcriptional regulator [Glaciimonas sp. PCH181]
MVWLRSFDAAARHGNFTRAAAELCVSQGAISQQVKSLENALRRPLFIRGPRSLTLTPEGERLYAVARDAFRALDATLIQLRRTEDRHDVSLSCSPSFAMGWLIPKLNNFFRQHATIHLKIHGEFHGLDRSRLVREGLDAAVRYDLGRYTDLEARKFLDEWLLPVASPEFIKEHPELISPSDLRPEWLLHDSSPWEGASEFEEWEYWLEQVGVSSPDLASGRHFNLSQLAQAGAVNGQGVAMGRAALVLDDLMSGRLVDLFGICVPSGAGYFFVTEGSVQGPLASVEAWLCGEAKAYLDIVKRVLPYLR